MVQLKAADDYVYIVHLHRIHLTENYVAPWRFCNSDKQLIFSFGRYTGVQVRILAPNQ